VKAEWYPRERCDKVRFVPILLKNSSSKHFRYVAENAIPRPS